MIKEYKILGVKVHALPEHILKSTLNTFLHSDSQHQIATVNPEFIVACQKNQKFLQIINNASLAAIDGAGIIKALQFLENDVYLDDRITGVRLTEILISLALKNNYKIMFCLYSRGLTRPDDFFIKTKQKYPLLEFQVADENNALEKGNIFSPDIMLVGFGAPRQDLWINENLDRLPSVKIAAGVGGTFDFMAKTKKRAPKLLRSLGLEWFWRLILQPWRIKRIARATIFFFFLVIKDNLKNKHAQSKN